MKVKKSAMTHNELHRLLKEKYNSYQNANIYDSNYNYTDTEFSKELYNEKQEQQNNQDNPKPF